VRTTPGRWLEPEVEFEFVAERVLGRGTGLPLRWETNERWGEWKE
jgi:hypothetical protein